MTADRAALHRPIRPRAGRAVAYGVALAWLLLCGAMAVGVPAPVPGLGPVDRAGFVLLGLAGAYLLHRLGGVAVLPSETGVVVRNVGPSRRLDWAEVVDVRFGSDSTWGRLDLSDGTSLQAMGIQGADGAHATRDAVRLATLVELHSRESGAGTAGDQVPG